MHNATGMNSKGTTKPNIMGCATLIVAFIFVFAAASTCGGEPKTPQQAHADSVQALFSPASGAHYGLRDFVTSQLRDPDSFEHIRTNYFDIGNGLVTVEMDYRARNGFGGMNICRILAKSDMNGNIVEVLASEN